MKLSAVRKISLMYEALIVVRHLVKTRTKPSKHRTGICCTLHEKQSMAQSRSDVVKHVPQLTWLFVRLLIVKEGPLWRIASQAVKRKTCYCVGRTRTVTSPHVWPSTAHWGVKRGIVKAKRPGPTRHCLRIHVWVKGQDKRQVLFVLSVFWMWGKTR